MAAKEYYKILGVKQERYDKDIKQAYRKLAVSIILMLTPATSLPRPGSRR